MSKAKELLEKTLVEVDVFNAAILTVLVMKNIITIKEFEEVKDYIRPDIIKAGEKSKEKMKQAIEEDKDLPNASQ